MRSDAFSQLHKKSMIAAGHAHILGVLSFRCVWHARHLKLMAKNSMRVGFVRQGCELRRVDGLG